MCPDPRSPRLVSRLGVMMAAAAAMAGMSLGVGGEPYRPKQPTTRVNAMEIEINKTNKLWVKVGRVSFTCASIEKAVSRVDLFFNSWYEAGLCSLSDKNDWNVWSNRRSKYGSRKHIANIYYGEVR